MRQRLALLALLSATPVFAGEPYLVKDINPEFRSADSALNDFVTVSGSAVFAATTPEDGHELWASDGTAAGTFLLADICPGECSGSPRRIAVTPRGYFFAAYDGSQEGVWVTQGTPASTFRLAEGLFFPAGFRWTAFVESRGLLFFLAHDNVHGIELWRTDGTPAGTFLAADVHPGIPGSDIQEMGSFAGRVFFSADDGVTGRSLWSSDGTPAGTRLVKDTWPGNDFDQEGPTRLRPSSRWLYFFARGPKGRELWKSDGTSRGTQLVADLVPGPGSLVVSDARVGRDRLFFVAQTDDKGQELWTSDGTARGTRRLTSFAKPEPFFAGFVVPLLPLGNRLVFPADDGVHGREIWVTDGTAKGTRLLLDVLPGSGSGVSTLWQTYKGRILFDGTDGRRGQELWTSDGTPQGTRMIRDICRGSCDSFTFPFASLGDRLLLRADDGRSGAEIWRTDGTAKGTVRVSNSEVPLLEGGFKGAAASGRILFAQKDAIHGEELWVTDGTNAGTGLLADLNDANQVGSSSGSFMRLGDELLFTASDGQRAGLWKSDGTAAGTTFVKDLNPEPGAPPPPGFYIPDWEEAGGRLLFFAQGENASLWRTDGTAAGTVRLDLESLPFEGSLRRVGDKIFFVARDEIHGAELWVSDGTVEGTRLVADLGPGESGSDPQDLTSYQGKLFFIADAPNAGRELWMSDGTQAGTVLVRNIDPALDPDSLNPTSLTLHQGFLYFSAEDREHGRELWRSDGTAAGTVRVTDLGPGPESFRIDAMTSAGPRLFLWNANVSALDNGLWVSDGTAAGTRFIKAVFRNPLFVPPVELDGLLYFSGSGSSRTTLWRSDGTEAGTFPLLREEDIPHHSLDLGSLAAAGGLLFFPLEFDGTSLWRTNGTTAGTFKLRDQASSPFAIGPRVYFTSYDPATGYELWAIDTRED